MLCAHTGEILPGILSDLYAWRILEEVRETWIDDPGCAVRKIEGTGGKEGRPEREREKKKHRGRTYTFLLFAHANTYLQLTYMLRVGGRVHTRGDETRPDVTYNVKTRRGIARNNYKHRGVTINLPRADLLDNNKRITGGGGRETVVRGKHHRVGRERRRDKTVPWQGTRERRGRRVSLSPPLLPRMRRGRRTSTRGARDLKC